MSYRVTQEQVKDLFEYREDGNLIRKVKTSNRVKVGEVVGWITAKRYKAVHVGSKPEYIHRLVFLYHHGYMPECIDHIDNDPLNNRIENLRAASFGENMLNIRGYAGSKSGVKGVSWSQSSKKWSVLCRVNKKYKYMGVYEDLELAELVAIEARNKYHGEFANHKLKGR
jgi:hypothetical protein